MDTRDVQVRYATEAELRTAWNRYIKHGALAAPVHPPPQSGDILIIHIAADWAEAEAQIEAQVLQASLAFTIANLAPLSDEARAALVSMGLVEAAGDDLPPPDETMVSEAPPGVAPPGATTEPHVSPVSVDGSDGGPLSLSLPVDDDYDPEGDTAVLSAPEAMSAPEPPAAQGPVSTSFGSPGSNSRIKAVAFSPHVAPPPRPGTRPPPPAPSLASGSMPAAQAAPPGDPDDLRYLASLSGPAHMDTESALPAITRHGDLGESTWRDALLELLTANETGVVVIHGFREVRWAYLVDGRPVHFAGDHPHPGEFLSDFVREVGVDEAKWRAALRVQKFTGLPAGLFLVSRGWLSQEGLQRALLARAQRIAERLVGANFGKWSFHPLDDLRHVYPYQGLDVVGLLFVAERHAAARIEDDALIEKMQPYYDDHIAQVAERLRLLEGLDLGTHEQSLVDEYLSGGWTIKELLSMRVMEERPLLRILLVLMGLGIIEMRHEEGALARRNRAERKLFVALRDVTKRPPFEALHCHWSAVEPEVRAGWKRTVAEWSLDRFQDVADDRIRDLILRIKARADELQTLLLTQEGRDGERKKIIDEGLRVMASDLLIKQADMEVYKGNTGVARSCYERVLELAPKGDMGHEYRATAKARLSDPTVGNARMPGADRPDPVFLRIDKAVAEARKKAEEAKS